MKPELKDKWTTALRSGKYKQTTERMLDPEGGMCCLGVLADVCGLKVVAVEDTEGDDESDLNGKIYDQVHDMIGGQIFNFPTAKLARMNDSGKTFDQIADWIEENL